MLCFVAICDCFRFPSFCFSFLIWMLEILWSQTFSLNTEILVQNIIFCSLLLNYDLFWFSCLAFLDFLLFICLLYFTLILLFVLLTFVFILVLFYGWFAFATQKKTKVLADTHLLLSAFHSLWRINHFCQSHDFSTWPWEMNTSV